MTSYLPTIKQLTYLVALKEYGHFGKAAEHCFVTQSTLSAGLRELENLLGLTLVERTRRVVRFTPLGNSVVDKARNVIREAEELTAMVKSAGQPLSGELRMSVIPTIAPFLLPQILPGLRKEKPDLRLVLREELSASACEALHHGHIDCALVALPYATGEVESEVLFEDSFYVAYPAEDAVGLPDFVTPDMIDNEKLLLLEDGHCLKDHVLSACNRPDMLSGASMIGTSLHTLLMMVDNGLGMTLVPQMAADSCILDGTNIVIRPLKAQTNSRDIAIVWRKNSPRGEEFRMLAKIIRELYHGLRAQKMAAE